MIETALEMLTRTFFAAVAVWPALLLHRGAVAEKSTVLVRFSAGRRGQLTLGLGEWTVWVVLTGLVWVWPILGGGESILTGVQAAGLLGMAIAARMMRTWDHAGVVATSDGLLIYGFRCSWNAISEVVFHETGARATGLDVIFEKGRRFLRLWPSLALDARDLTVPEDAAELLVPHVSVRIVSSEV